MRELCVLFLSGLIASTAFSMDSEEVLDEPALGRSSRVSVPEADSDWDGDDEGKGVISRKKPLVHKKKASQSIS